MPLTTIGADAIDSNAVTTIKINNDAVDGEKIAMGSDAAGDVLYHNGTDYVRLAVGTAGQALKVASGAASVEWGTDQGTTINTNADNRLISGSDTANTLNGEANLTYDGTTVDIKNGGTASDIKVYCENANSHYTSIKSAAHSAYTGGSWTFTLPGTDGSADEFLTTNGSGVTSWASVPAGAPTGGGTEKVFYENENAVDADYTLTTNFNAVTAGPVTVASGVTITVPTGQAWVIV